MGDQQRQEAKGITTHRSQGRKGRSDISGAQSSKSRGEAGDYGVSFGGRKYRP